jgi:hypothetical protein
MSIDLTALGAPFADADLEWRVQTSGKGGGKGVWALIVPYLTSRAVQQRLDDVCGPANWRNEFVTGPSGGVLCGISVYLSNGMDGLHWVTKWDGAENTDIEGVKGGLSGAMKRAAVQWGMGRHLYGVGDVWADCSLEKKTGEGWSRAKTKDGLEFWWKPPILGHARPTASKSSDAAVQSAVAQASEMVSLAEQLGDEAIKHVENLLSKPLSLTEATKTIDALRKRVQKAAA